ncbi:MAG: TIGR02147 family protein [Fibrobacter sp.]|nr:TIGR02147 family protein [Fibrobacter sp.]
MDSITEYTSYRKYIKDFYEDEKRKGKFTWRKFASLAGYSSPVFLKLVCDGTGNLGDSAIDNVAKAMGLAGFEREYFGLLVLLDRTESNTEKAHIVEELKQLASKHRAKVLDGDAFDYFKDWKNPVLREIAAAMPTSTANEMADMCLQKVTVGEVKDSLAFMMKNQLLQKDVEGYHMTNQTLTSSSGGPAPIAIREMHRQMGTFALDSLDSVPIDERDVSGLTLGVSEKSFAQIKDELARFRKKILAIAMAGGETERVYRLNLQFFPMSKKLK